MPAGMPLGGARRLQRRHELRSPLCAARRRVILNRTMPTPGNLRIMNRHDCELGMLSVDAALGLNPPPGGRDR